MASNVYTLGGLFSFLTLLIALFMKHQSDQILNDRLEAVLSGLIRAEKKASFDTKVKVAVGFGSCLDVVSDALDVLTKLNSSVPEEPEHVAKIENLEHLEKIFSYFFQNGAAAERFTGNKTLFSELVEAANSLQETAQHLGGNAPVMASRFELEGADVLLGAKISQKLQKRLHKDIKVVGGSVERDDIHLLLEYPRDAVWGSLVAPRANRFIIHSDENNPYLTSMEEFFTEVKLFSPDLLIVSGLQMMDNYPFNPGERRATLQKLRRKLEELPKSVRVHFEMASFAEQECLQDIIENVVLHVDSLGMNEQELPNLFSVLTYGNVTILADSNPRVATTLDHMRAVFEAVQEKREEIGGKGRPLTRLHIHTLAYQAILTTHSSPWRNTMSAAAKASLVANRHICGSNWIYLDKARIIMDDGFSTSVNQGRRITFQANRPVSCWDENGVKFCVAPNLVCTDVVQTGGGGDNISSAGLILQVK